MTRRAKKQPVVLGLREAFPESRFFQLDRTDLNYIVEVLNQKPQGGVSPYAEELIRLVEGLKECSGNLKKMMDDDPELAKAVREVCITRWMPSTNGRAHLVLQPSMKHIRTPEQVGQMRPERYAALLFHVGTLNPEWDKLAGPCARCRRYYLKNRASQKVYCSPKCGNAVTALARTRERLKSEREQKLRVAAELTEKWRTARTKDDWKQWVSKQRVGVKEKITPKFLTRAVNHYGLLAPTKGRQT